MIRSLIFMFIIMFFNLFGDELESRSISNANYRLQEKYKLKSLGMGFFEAEMQGYSLSYITYKKMDIPKARRLIINLLSDLNLITNAFVYKKGFKGDKKGKKMLFCDIAVDLEHRSKSADSVDAITYYNGRIDYEQRVGDTSKFSLLHSESYEEALGIVSKQVLFGEADHYND